MARMVINMADFDGIQQMLDKVDKAARPETCKRMLEAAGQIYAQEMNNAVESFHHVVSRDLMRSAKVVKVEENSNGYWTAKVMYDGYDSKGVANDLKANILLQEKDKKFLKAAQEAAKPKAAAEMQRILNEIIGG